jgi:hypothetical protein
LNILSYNASSIFSYYYQIQTSYNSTAGVYQIVKPTSSSGYPSFYPQLEMSVNNYVLSLRLRQKGTIVTFTDISYRIESTGISSVVAQTFSESNTTEPVVIFNSGVYNNYLQQLIDTNISSPTTNQVLTYNGTKWQNESLPSNTNPTYYVTSITYNAPTANANYIIQYTGIGMMNFTMPPTSSLTTGQIINISTIVGLSTQLNLNTGQYWLVNSTASSNPLLSDNPKFINNSISFIFLGSPSTTNYWVPLSVVSPWYNSDDYIGLSELSTLTDVGFSTLAVNDTMSYNGTVWINQQPTPILNQLFYSGSLASFGTYYLGYQGVTTLQNGNVYIPINNMKFVSISVLLNVPAGVGNSWTFSLAVNGSASSLSTTLSGSMLSNTSTGSVSVIGGGSGNTYSVIISSTGTPSASPIVCCSLLYQ